MAAAKPGRKELARRDFTPSPAEVAAREARQAYDNAQLFRDAGNFAGARAGYELALVLCEGSASGIKLKGSILNDLGSLLHYELHRPKEAQSYYEDALRYRSGIIFGESFDTVVILNNLARSLSDQGQREQAEPYFARAKEKLKRYHIDPELYRVEKEVNPGILEDGRVGSRTERLPAGDLDKREHSKTDLIARLEEVEAAAREVCPEIIPGLRRSKIIAKGMPPKWGDPDLPKNLKVLTAPLFLKHFYPDLIVDGVVDRSVIREFDRGLMADIEQYIFRRKKRKQDLGDATGLRFVGGRFDEQHGHGGSFRKKSTGGRPERKTRRSIRAATP